MEELTYEKSSHKEPLVHKPQEVPNREIGWGQLDFGKYLASSAVLWTLEEGSVYPFDLVKARLQVQGAIPDTNFRYANTFDSFRQIMKYEGFRGFWKGFGTQVVGSVPTQVLYFASYECFTHYATKLVHTMQFRNVWTEFGIDCFAGAVAEIVSACIWIPADIIVQRLQIQGPGVNRYSGAVDALSKIVGREGIAGLFRGIGPTLATFVPHGAVQFGVYQATKKALYSSNVGLIPKDAEEKGYHRVNIISGFVAGTVAAIVTNPMDVAKTRIQTQEYSQIRKFMDENKLNVFKFPKYPDVAPKYYGTVRTIRLIVKEEGYRALGKGLVARIMGGAPAAAMGFFVYEIIKIISFKH